MIKTYRFRFRGFTADFINSHGAVGATTGLVSPMAYQDATFDESYLQDVIDSLQIEGWELVETNPLTIGAKSIAQIVKARVDTNLAPALGLVTYTDILALTVITKGGSSLGIVASMIGSVALGVSVRLVIYGGSFGTSAAPTIIGGKTLALLATADYNQSVPQDLPATTSYTTYTIKLQALATVALGSLTIAALASPDRAGASLTAFEYV